MGERSGERFEFWEKIMSGQFPFWSKRRRFLSGLASSKLQIFSKIFWERKRCELGLIGSGEEIKKRTIHERILNEWTDWYEAVQYRSCGDSVPQRPFFLSLSLSPSITTSSRPPHLGSSSIWSVLYYFSFFPPLSFPPPPTVSCLTFFLPSSCQQWQCISGSARKERERVFIGKVKLCKINKNIRRRRSLL